MDACGTAIAWCHDDSHHHDWHREEDRRDEVGSGCCLSHIHHLLQHSHTQETNFDTAQAASDPDVNETTLQGDGANVDSDCRAA